MLFYSFAFDSIKYCVVLIPSLGAFRVLCLSQEHGQSPSAGAAEANSETKTLPTTTKADASGQFSQMSENKNGNRKHHHDDGHGDDDDDEILSAAVIEGIDVSFNQDYNSNQDRNHRNHMERKTPLAPQVQPRTSSSQETDSPVPGSDQYEMEEDSNRSAGTPSYDGGRSVRQRTGDHNENEGMISTNPLPDSNDIDESGVSKNGEFELEEAVANTGREGEGGKKPSSSAADASVCDLLAGYFAYFAEEFRHGTEVWYYCTFCFSTGRADFYKGNVMLRGYVMETWEEAGVGVGLGGVCCHL